MRAVATVGRKELRQKKGQQGRYACHKIILIRKLAKASTKFAAVHGVSQGAHASVDLSSCSLPHLHLQYFRHGTLEVHVEGELQMDVQDVVVTAVAEVTTIFFPTLSFLSTFSHASNLFKQNVALCQFLSALKLENRFSMKCLNILLTSNLFSTFILFFSF